MHHVYVESTTTRSGRQDGGAPSSSRCEGRNAESGHVAGSSAFGPWTGSRRTLGFDMNGTKRMSYA